MKFWPNLFKLNRFETGLSASVNGALYTLCLARGELKDVCVGGLGPHPLKEVLTSYAQAG